MILSRETLEDLLNKANNPLTDMQIMGETSQILDLSKEVIQKHSKIIDSIDGNFDYAYEALNDLKERCKEMSPALFKKKTLIGREVLQKDRYLQRVEVLLVIVRSVMRSLNKVKEEIISKRIKIENIKIESLKNVKTLKLRSYLLNEYYFALKNMAEESNIKEQRLKIRERMATIRVHMNYIEESAESLSSLGFKELEAQISFFDLNLSNIEREYSEMLSIPLLIKDQERVDKIISTVIEKANVILSRKQEAKKLLFLMISQNKTIEKGFI